MIARLLRWVAKLAIGSIAFIAVVGLLVVVLGAIYAPQAVRDSLAYVGDTINVGLRKDSDART